MGEKLTFIDLFSGTGAFSYVLEKNMCKCVFSNDIINESKLIYSLNNNSECFHLGDINNIEIKYQNLIYYVVDSRVNHLA